MTNDPGGGDHELLFELLIPLLLILGVTVLMLIPG